VNYSDYYLLRKGKYLVTQGDLNSAASALGSIGNTSKAFVESRLLLSNVNYRLGDVNAAIKNLESAVPKLSSERTEKFRNLTYLTLARLYFQKGNYKQSYAHFLNIDKSSSYWLQSTTEQALTQIMAGDYIGAAGNMFSLHTEYFKKAYAPESYLIRAVGYLNLCQFGDSVSVVNELQRRYSKVSEQIQSFQSQNKNSSDYYGLIKELFAKSDAPDIKGVPKPFLIELARHPSYIGIQKRINSYEDEVARFSTVANNLANKAASLRQQIAAAKNESNALKNKVASTMLMEQQQRKVLTLESQLSMALNGREKIEKMKSQAAERLIGEKGKLKVLAGEVLQKRYAVAAKELTETLEQKDVLAYEVYSGAGEHIRYQMAGGESKERLPATALTPEEKQSYKWKFKGEVWEDEIGHYRSSLTNVCAKDDFAKNTGGK
jgi:tetratricopeptide (TPR) repeat protein